MTDNAIDAVEFIAFVVTLPNPTCSGLDELVALPQMFIAMFGWLTAKLLMVIINPASAAVPCVLEALLMPKANQ